MIYEFEIKDIKKTVIPVRAVSSGEAQKIFDKWYEKHTDDPKDTTIDDLLDDSYDGRIFCRSTGIPEKDYPIDGFILPEESDTPIEPSYDLYIRYGEDVPVVRHKLTITDIANKLSKTSETHYLFIDTKTKSERSRIDKKGSAIYIYAVPKEDEKEEIWYECR